MDGNRLRHWLTLARIRGLDCAALKPLLDELGCPEAALDAVRSGRAAGIKAKVVKEAKEFNDRGWTSEELDRAESSGVRLVTYLDSEYPPLLREIDDPPVVLYVKGRPLPAGLPSVAVVGTRRPSRYGRAVSEGLAREMAARGLVIISGMARGCDSAAHAGALAAGGVTVAVLGTGMDVCYPRENGRLFAEICSEGVAVTEYPFATPPVPHNFPRRNRIIAGLSLGVLVVEAPVRSGSLMTARLALEYNRDVFACPGQVTSAASSGANKLIKEGAMLVESADDVVAGLGLVPVPDGDRAGANGDEEPWDGEDEQETDDAPAGLTEQEALVWRSLEEGPVQIDEITAATGLTPSGASTVLFSMELKGLVEQFPGKCFARRIVV